ncbi:DNA-directed RNA polymerase subunit beta [Alphaproteobacteria bacterium]|nr:DNA-directed RNA polymerase subunit beta [Alphaproteobacteria bacterium]
MSLSFTEKKRIRYTFGKIEKTIDVPNLVDIQKISFDKLLQLGKSSEERTSSGLQEVFSSVFPIKDYAGKSELHYIDYYLDNPKYDVDECRRKGLTFSASLMVTFRLIIWDIDEETEEKTLRDIKEQVVYLGDLPLMTNNGTFVVNGTERVVVSQLHRSPGVFFDHDDGKTHASGKTLYNARIIPYRGSWLDFEFDHKDNMFFRIDRKKKMIATTILQSLPSSASEKYLAECKLNKVEPDIYKVSGMTSEEILTFFYKSYKFKKNKDGWILNLDINTLKNKNLPFDLVNPSDKEILAHKDIKLSLKLLNEINMLKINKFFFSEESLYGFYLSKDVVNLDTGMVYAEAGTLLNDELFLKFKELSINDFSIINASQAAGNLGVINSLIADKNHTREEALFDMFKILRPGEPPTLEASNYLFNNMFFNEDRYDLSEVGRVKINSYLTLDKNLKHRVLDKNDILSVAKRLFDMKTDNVGKDDIDHLGNRRVRSVGELIENQYRIGLVRMERAIREKMGTVDIESIMPQDLVNSKPIQTVLKEFTGSSQLSQFMDQTNPLSEITHKRRISALGPGGLTRERAGFEVRDVHTTHYGRICPIETPEGSNIGLINSLSSYARINQYGFIETPYRKINKGIVSNNVLYLNADEEENYTIAQANSPINDKGGFIEESVSCRRKGDFIFCGSDEIDFMDVNPQQLVSVAASLIPFLENDDANRALMGSNMMRQAVPLMKNEAPLVGTGFESKVARDSGAVVVSKNNGYVYQVDASRVVIRSDSKNISKDKSGVDIYNLKKFQRSNQSTAINQKPIVKIGDYVKRGDIIADGPCTDLGELALGRNLLVGFMPWNGYNFEDSIIMSEKVVQGDKFTSIHIEEFEVLCRDTKLGPEEITRDMPNVADESITNLDEAGIVYIGSEVKHGDILVGKVSPKGDSPITPEEKLLRAIFSEKAADVKDTSLRLPTGYSGVVVDVQVLVRRGVDKDERTIAIERVEIDRLAKDRDDEKEILENNYKQNLVSVFEGMTSSINLEELKAGNIIEKNAIQNKNIEFLEKLSVKDDTVMETVTSQKKIYNDAIILLDKKFQNKIEKIQSGDDLLPGVLKVVKVFVAVKRRLQTGDKMAGRHGNKGVVSKIVPVEDMPFLEDGTPVDILLNPLGVPSRMNIGQILETHLGWAAYGIGQQISKSLDLARKEGNVNQLKNTITNFYENNKNSVETIAEMNDDQLVELATNLEKGVTFATPVFDGTNADEITELLSKAGFDNSGQVYLHDGRSGERFERKVTVGFKYVLKLHHLIDDKIHARSIGPYSLVTQQPLGGKAQFGGQRFGEMEVWALEAYGASNTLQEMLTIKSDDVAGRTKVYEALIRGDYNFESGIPESFHVLVKELKSLGLNVELIETEPSNNRESA